MTATMAAGPAARPGEVRSVQRWVNLGDDECDFAPDDTLRQMRKRR